MAASPPPTLSSFHRPIALFLAGTAAACTAYLIYTSLCMPARKGELHRTQTIRRPNRRTRNRVVGRPLAQREQVPTPPHEFDFFGQLLGPDRIPSEDELRALARQLDPAATPEAIDGRIDQLQEAFLDSVFATVVSTDPSELPASVDIDLSSFPEAAIQRAIQRQVARVAEQNTDFAAQPIYGQPNSGMAYTEAQALQAAIYNVAEERVNNENIIHRGVACNACGRVPHGIRWHCANCWDFDLCSDCEATVAHEMTHIFYKIKIPAPFLTIPRQKPIYPGKPSAMPEFLSHSTKQSLEQETNLGRERIDALWDEFRCLAATEWDGDDYGIGWGIDRANFDRTFLPRYPHFPTQKNLLYDRLFAFYDSDSNGIIGFAEFVKGLDGFYNKDGTHLGDNGQPDSSQNKRLENLFKLYDADGDGYITRKDVLKMFRAHYAIQKESIRNKLANEDRLRRLLPDLDQNKSLSAIYQPDAPGEDELAMAADRAPAPSGSPTLRENTDDAMPRNMALREGFAERGMDAEETMEERRKKGRFYLDEEEGLVLPEGLRDPDLASSDPVERLYRDILYQQIQQGLNELLDPVFKGAESRAMSLAAARERDPSLKIDLEDVEGVISFADFKAAYDGGCKYLDVWSDLVQF
ncbi:uncharacterized protein EI97DRAFT_434608 [Westerdykella ornata]|uniref:EF-hand n=1 Tax=Westerdykella ornata TaxID=318751 RepID=A0A6A6JF59_WESOR|nr:uncharacterized protein EI97DRAFT_434608 [Westerdykella ornata]KAF2275042.1 hypothetical protein EI97DRAFT_434608 [Westerdykella ornata]